MRKLFLTFVAVLFVFILCADYLIPGGTYTTSQIWTLSNQPYIVQGDVTFTAGASLTIEAGVSVKFIEDADLTILGSIIAIGTLNNPILFYANNSQLKWEGLHITGSTSSELTYCDITDSDKGGLIISSSSNINITNCNIHHNTSEEGAGITVKEGSQNIEIVSCGIHYNLYSNEVGGSGILCANSNYITIDDNDIFNNTAYNSGGGILLITCNYTIITENNIMNNTASTGGGIYIDYGIDNSIQYNEIYGNSTIAASGNGGGVFLKTKCNLLGNDIYDNDAGSGGGVYADSWNGDDRVFQDNLIHDNTAIGRGGGVLMFGSATIDNCEIYSNTAGDAGGGIHCCIRNPIILNCKIYDNTSNGDDYGGGGISVFNCNPTIIKTEISNNHAILGAGIFINDDTVFNGQIDRTIIDRCTISGNGADTLCGGLYVYSVNSYEYSIVDCKNSIIYNNDASVSDGNEILIETFYGQVDESYITYNCIEPNGLYVDGNQSIVIVENNIYEDPLFDSPTLNNFNLTLPSPCIDAGDPMSPLDPDDTITDLGCYYYDHFGYDIHVLNNGCRWLSFPRLERDETINEEADIVLVLSNTTYFTPFNFTYLAMETEDDPQNPGPELYFEDPTWYPSSYNICSSWLCKIMVMPTQERVLKVYGERLAEDLVLDEDNDPRFPLAGYENHWLGYWLYESRNIFNAFGPYWEYVEEIWSEDWYYNKNSNNSVLGKAEPVSWSSANKTLEYGKGYIVRFERISELAEFHWTPSAAVEESKKKAESENFTYTELLDYEVIDVVEIPEHIIEIGVFQYETCVGSVVVEDPCEQILVYCDNVSREPIPFNFEVITNERSLNIHVDNYLVYNENSGEFETGFVVSGRRKNSIIKFGDIEETQNELPEIVEVELYNNHPNPFNPETNISFSITAELDVQLTIYNLKGQKVKELVKGHLPSGRHSVIWNGIDDDSKQIGSGFYIYKLKTSDKEISKKMLLLK